MSVIEPVIAPTVSVSLMSRVSSLSPNCGQYTAKTPEMRILFFPRNKFKNYLIFMQYFIAKVVSYYEVLRNL